MAPGSSRLAWAVLVLGGLLVVLVLLWPSGAAIRIVQIRTWDFVRFTLFGGHLRWLTPEVWSDLINIALFIPPAAALVVLSSRVPWWGWFLGLTGLSGMFETFQALAYPSARVGSLHDVVVNSTGALLGVLIGRSVARRRARDEREHEEAENREGAAG